jgi:hypothetical protein
MEGISYVVDENNQRKAVVIDLEKHGQLWEDFCDNLMADATKDEETIPWEKAKQELKGNA